MTGIAVVILVGDVLERLTGNTPLLPVLFGICLMGLGFSFRFARYGPDDCPTIGSYFVLRFAGWTFMGIGLLALVEGLR